MRLSWFGLLLIAAAACGEEDDALLLVDVRTDLAPGIEFDEVRTEVIAAPGGAAGRFTVAPVGTTADGLGGIRVAELSGIPDGDVELLVQLLRDGSRVAERPVRLTHAGRTAVTVLIQRSCAVLDCAAGTACYAGRCVDPRCTVGTPDRCGDGECSDAADCAASECADTTCVGGACFYPSAECAPDGGQTVDAGAADAGAEDGGTGGDGGGALDDTACDDVHIDRLLCESFEAGTFAAFSDVNSGNGAIDFIIVDDLVYRGSRAARVRKEDGQTSVYLRTSVLDGLGAGDTLHVRWYLYVPLSYTLTEYSNLIWMGVEHSNALVLSMRPGNELRLGAPPGSQSASGGMGSLDRDRWMCIETMLRLGDGGIARAWVDGTLIAEIPSVSATPAGPSDIVIVGLPYSPAGQPAGEVYVDELVASTTPIGCD